ncbi:hypothetical protein BG004_005677 [Podila humilis]|nr:hypothetical protein BG004_005677 [Podila humilis]
MLFANPNTQTPSLAKISDSTVSAVTLQQHVNDTIIAKKQYHQRDYILQQQRIQQQQQRFLLYTQEQRRLQYLRCSNQLQWHQGPPRATTSTSLLQQRQPQTKCQTSQKAVDLVDDIWRLVTYILASDCTDLGRMMQVNRRFHDMIVKDPLLWRLTYRLTVSGSMFSSQKSLLSPSWIREEHSRAGSDLFGSLGNLDRTPNCQTAMRPPLFENSGQFSQDDVGAAVNVKHDGSLTSVLNQQQPNLIAVPTLGLQLPSQLVLPHHRRIVQQAISTPSELDSRSSKALSHSATTPQSSPFSCSMPSFCSNSKMPADISKVLSSSTIPLTVVQHLVPSTTLKHHAPAVYWRHQVVEWLEHEKLRRLRLGLFWGFSLDASRNHGCTRR